VYTLVGGTSAVFWDHPPGVRGENKNKKTKRKRGRGKRAQIAGRAAGGKGGRALAGGNHSRMFKKAAFPGSLKKRKIPSDTHRFAAPKKGPKTAPQAGAAQKTGDPGRKGGGPPGRGTRGGGEKNPGLWQCSRGGRGRPASTTPRPTGQLSFQENTRPMPGGNQVHQGYGTPGHPQQGTTKVRTSRGF